MLSRALRHVKPAVLLLALLTLLTGAAYPGLVTGLAWSLFPRQAEGSLLSREGTVIGSALIGQSFTDPGRFWGRPSATTPRPYDASASSGSNLGPTNPAFLALARERIAGMRRAHGDGPVPVELVTASGSGLDPHISPAAAFYQAPRVARARGLAEDTVRRLVQRHVEGRQFGVLGEARVNILGLNLALDALDPNGENQPATDAAAPRPAGQ